MTLQRGREDQVPFLAPQPNLVTDEDLIGRVSRSGSVPPDGRRVRVRAVGQWLLSAPCLGTLAALRQTRR